MKTSSTKKIQIVALLALILTFETSLPKAYGQGNSFNTFSPQINIPTNNFGAINAGNGNLSNNSLGIPANTTTTSEATTNSTVSTAGELISLEYRNAPFVEVIRALAEGANLNITLSAEVEKGSPVTIRLNKVTYEQALKAILETYKFGAVAENGILKIDTTANLAKVREEKLKERESAWKTLPTKRLVWQVNYAKAADLNAILDSMLKGYKPDPRFSIISDKRTNKIIIEGIPDALVEAKSILENLDRLKQQVLIEARIVEASSELSKTLSVTWGTRFGLDGNRGLANGLIFPNSLGGSLGGAGALGAGAPGPGLATAPTQLGTLQFTVGSINNLVNIDAVLRAYETESLANVIASPRVVVQDQEKAVIKEDITISRSVLSIEGKPENRETVASISLQVSPQITSENTLELDINVERQTPTNPPSDPVQGSIKRQANTKLIVSNGETAVIGGLYQTQKFKGQGRIPVLGRLPLIGGLFRSNEEQSFRSELMVLITPRILPSAQSRSASRTDVPILGGTSIQSNTQSNNAESTGNNANSMASNNSQGNGYPTENTRKNNNSGQVSSSTNNATNASGATNNTTTTNNSNSSSGSNSASVTNEIGNSAGSETNASSNSSGNLASQNSITNSQVSPENSNSSSSISNNSSGTSNANSTNSNTTNSLDGGDL